VVGAHRDHRLLDAHEVAVTAALEHVERFGSTTRIRADGARLHPDTNGLTIATFRQTTSRADDPQIHTHAVISAKVQTAEGRWLALDARYLKRHQRMLGGLYQSVLRAELTHRFGVDWLPIVNGQAEIAGVPEALIVTFSKRSGDIDLALAAKVDAFRQREGRDPSRWEQAALTREASADTRSRKTGHGAPDLATRWRVEAVDLGWGGDRLERSIEHAAHDRPRARVLTVKEVVDAVSATRSSWGRPDVIEAICDVQRPLAHIAGRRWGADIERCADRVVEHLVDLDPPAATPRRASDGRSVWIEPTAPRLTSEAVLEQEEQIVTWAMEAQSGPLWPSPTVDRRSLDVLQAEAAASVAGHDRLVLVVGPAGAGKTRMLTAAAADLHAHGRSVFGVAPTAKAARTLERDIGIPSDTVAKLLHEFERTDRPPLPQYQLGRRATLIVDEAGMLSTPALHRVVVLAHTNGWRLVLVGDPRQLQGVGRGGMLAELCANGRVDELVRLHRFTHPWEATASLLLRSGDPRAFDAYQAHGRIIAGALEEHLARMAAAWIDHRDNGRVVALVASRNDHVHTVNLAVQQARLDAGHLDADASTLVAGGEHAHVGDVVMTRRNDRRLVTSAGEPVRNRDIWTVTHIDAHGSITVSHEGDHGAVTLPARYAREHVRLGYAATEHGWESDTVAVGISLASAATTRRGLYVAATRGRDSNEMCVITESPDVAEARDVLEAIVAVDRADIPAVTQRRTLAVQQRPHEVPVPVAPTPRCEIPDWFTAVLQDARRDRDDAETRQAERAVQRQRLENAAKIADRNLRHVASATAPDRDAYARAAAQAADARRDYTAAQRRLEAAPWRHRRTARHAVEVARGQRERAEASLEQTRERTAPAVERYCKAHAEQRKAHDDLRFQDTADWLDTVRHPIDVHTRRLAALDTWRQWAAGCNIGLPDLQTALDTLTDASTSGRLPTAPLVVSLREWADHHQIDLSPGTTRALVLERPGLELEL
jgi:conjugative relaxase-like TrwC/TraI family protein